MAKQSLRKGKTGSSNLPIGSVGKQKPNRRFYSQLSKNQQRKAWLQILFFIPASILLLIVILTGGLTTLAELGFSLSRRRFPSSSPTPAPVFLSPPILSPLPSATNSSQIKLFGFSQKETTIEIFLNEESQGKFETDDQGQFESEITLKEGENEIYAVAQDLLGHYSPQSERWRVVLDEVPPELVIEIPTEGEKFYQEKSRLVEIKGQVEPEALVYLNDHLLIVDKKGRFSTQLKLSEGENLLRFLAQDQAGNQTKKEIKVFYQP